MADEDSGFPDYRGMFPPEIEDKIAELENAIEHAQRSKDRRVTAFFVRLSVPDLEHHVAGTTEVKDNDGRTVAVKPPGEDWIYRGRKYDSGDVESVSGGGWRSYLLNTAMAFGIGTAANIYSFEPIANPVTYALLSLGITAAHDVVEERFLGKSREQASENNKSMFLGQLTGYFLASML